MPITLNHLYIYNNPSSHRQKTHQFWGSIYIKININSTQWLQRHKQMITKICSKSGSLSNVSTSSQRNL